MLHEFLANNRSALIERCRTMVARRSGLKIPQPEFPNGIHVFIDQIIKTLEIEQADERPFEPGSTVNDSASGVVEAAILHGRDLHREGFTIEQVIRDYGDICQAVTGLASETGAPISPREFHTFNRLLDDAMAAAATEYSEGGGEGQKKTHSPLNRIFSRRKASTAALAIWITWKSRWANPNSRWLPLQRH